MKPERLFLGLDCSGHTYSVALYRGAVLGQKTGGQPRRHLAEMFPALHELCRECDTALRDVQAVAVTSGPGTFTGLRTALLVAKTLGQSLEVPIYPLDTLEVLAAASGTEGVVFPSIDARKNQVVWAPFRVRGRLALPMAPVSLTSPEQWSESVTGPVLGSACETYGSLLEGKTVLPRELWNPQAGVAARVAAAQIGGGLHWTKIRPEYVRPADVQVHSS